MARNIEIKARVGALARVRARAASLATEPSQALEQTDTFFAVPTGRLKVRAFPDGSGELIAYERPDTPGPKASTYSRFPCANADDLVRTLGRVLPERGTVAKRREVFLVGRTRVHLDDVDGLGYFVELEVVMREHESGPDAEREAREMFGLLGLSQEDQVAGAYIDLLERRQSATAPRSAGSSRR